MKPFKVDKLLKKSGNENKSYWCLWNDFYNKHLKIDVIKDRYKVEEDEQKLNRPDRKRSNKERYSDFFWWILAIAIISVVIGLIIVVTIDETTKLLLINNYNKIHNTNIKLTSGWLAPFSELSPIFFGFDGIGTFWMVWLPLLIVGCSITFMFLYYQVWYYFYFREHIWNFDKSWYLDDQKKQREKIRDKQIILNYEFYNKVSKLKERFVPVIFDRELYKKYGNEKNKNGYSATGEVMFTFLCNESEAKFIIQNGFLPESVFNRNVSDSNFESDLKIQSKKKIQDYFELIGLHKDGINTKSKYYYGAILSANKHSLMVGATGTGKGQYGVFPLLYANMLSTKPHSFVFTRKTELDDETEWLAQKYDYRTINLKLDNLTQSDNCNPFWVAMQWFKNKMALKYGKLQHITEYTVGECANFFELRLKRQNQKQVYSFECKNRSEVIDAIRTFEKNNNIDYYKPLQNYNQLTDGDFKKAVKNYHYDNFVLQGINQPTIKVTNLYNNTMWYQKEVLKEDANKKTNGYIDDAKKNIQERYQEVKDWYRVGNYVFLSEEHYKQQKDDALATAENEIKESIAAVSEIMADNAPSSSSGGEWKQWGKTVVEFFIKFFIELAEHSPLLTEEYLNLTSLGAWMQLKNVSQEDNEWVNFFEMMKGNMNLNLPRQWTSISTAYQTFNAPAQQFGSIKSTAEQLFEKFGESSQLAPYLMRNDVDFFSLNKKQTIATFVFNQNTGSDTNLLLPIVTNLFFVASRPIISSNIVGSNARSAITTRYLLDEAGSGFPPPANLITNALELGRSQDYWITACYQSITQIDEKKYPQRSEAIINSYAGNTHVQKCIGVKTQKDVDFWVKLFGKFKYEEKQYSFGRGGNGMGEMEMNADAKKWKQVTGVSVKEDDVFTASEIINKPDGKILTFVDEATIGNDINNKDKKTKLCIYSFNPPIAVSEILIQAQREAKKTKRTSNVPYLNMQNWKDDAFLDIFDVATKLATGIEDREIISTTDPLFTQTINDIFEIDQAIYSEDNFKTEYNLRGKADVGNNQLIDVQNEVSKKQEKLDKQKLEYIKELERDLKYQQEFEDVELEIDTNEDFIQPTININIQKPDTKKDVLHDYLSLQQDFDENKDNIIDRIEENGINNQDVLDAVNNSLNQQENNNVNENNLQEELNKNPERLFEKEIAQLVENKEKLNEAVKDVIENTDDPTKIVDLVADGVIQEQNKLDLDNKISSIKASKGLMNSILKKSNSNINSNIDDSSLNNQDNNSNLDNQDNNDNQDDIQNKPNDDGETL